MSRRPAFTLLVAGHRGGKTSFLRLLLHTLAPADFLHACARGPTVHFTEAALRVHPDSGPPLPLHLIDSPSLDFTDDHAAQRTLADTLHLIDHRFLDDLHVHLCIYFLNPDAIHPLSLRPALPPADITAIRRLSARVNVLPVIARADLLSNHRLAALKLAVRRDLADAGIGFGIFDTDDPSPDHLPPSDPPTATLNGTTTTTTTTTSSSSSSSPPPIMRLPYALVSPDFPEHHDARRPSFQRSYRWGNLDVLDPAHCDFVPLRNAIFHHMETLQKYTREYLFEKFRSDYIHHQQPPPRLHPISLPVPHRPILAIDTQPSHPLPLRPPVPSSANPKAPDPPSASVRSARSGQLPTHKQRSKKITVACNFCRSRKLKCDGGRPACGQCLKRAHHCDYAPQNKRRNTLRTQIPASSSRPPGIPAGPPEEDEDSTTGGDYHRAESGNEDVRSEVSMSPQVHTIPLSSSSSSAAPPPPPGSAFISQRSSNVDKYPSLPSILRARDDLGVPPPTHPPPPLPVPAPPPSPPPPSHLHDQESHPRLPRDSKPLLPSLQNSQPPPSSSSLGPSSSSSSSSNGGGGGGSGTVARSYFPDTDLPHIATLSLPDRSSPSTPAPMSAPSLPPIRPASEQQAALRKRAATVPGKTSSGRGSGSGPKVVACNSCRARKTKCDGAHPACSSCARRHFTCLYVHDIMGGHHPSFASSPSGSVNPSDSTASLKKRRATASVNPPPPPASLPSRRGALHSPSTPQGYIKDDENGSSSPRGLATPSTARGGVAGHHPSYPSFRASDSCRGGDPKIASDDGIIDKRDDRLVSVDARDIVTGGLGSREDRERPLQLEHMDRDMDMRPPHDPDITSADDALYHSSTHPSHHPRYAHSYHPLSRHDEMRVVKKMRIEGDSSTMVKQGGRGSPSSGRVTATAVSKP